MQTLVGKSDLLPKKEQENSKSEAERDVFVMPATPSQVRFWWLHKLKAENHAFNMPLAWICRGKLDYGSAQAAMTELVRRHESLRTTFEVVQNKLSQVIHPPFQVQLPMQDLIDLSDETRQQQADVIIRQESRIRMDMEKGPLFFARLIRLGIEEHIVLITIHHSVCDGWSNGVIIRDFAAIYDGLMRNVPHGLPELQIQFADFAVWLDQWRKGSERSQHLDYWRKTLGGDFTPLHIPSDSSVSNVEDHGEIETLLLAPDLVHRTKDFCAAHGVTLYMLLLSVYAMTLNRLTGQDDILIGTPCANRRDGTEDLVGPFSNPQVIRMRIDRKNSLGTVLEHVREWTVGAVVHQELPFEDLNEDDFFSTPQNQIQLQVYFIYQKAFMQAQRTPSLEIVPLRSVSPGATFDLMLSIVERTEGPRLQLEYNPGLFRASTIQSILRLFVGFLETTVSDIERPLEAVPELEANGQSRMLAANAGPLHGDNAVVGESNGALRLNRNLAEPTAALERPDYVAPHDTLELQIAEIWENALGLRKLSVRESFFDLGGRSLVAMRIVCQINRNYPVDFGVATLFAGNTIERMADLIRKRLSVNTSSSIVPMQPHGSASPLFILHGAGGNIFRFYQLAMLTGTEHPIYGIQAQSLLPGQPALLRLEDQAAYYLSEIRKIQPKGPYYFLGYSFGGTTALEIAHQLRALGERVELLGMLDSRQRDYMVVMLSQDSVRTRLDRRVARFLRNFGPLSFGEKVAFLKEKLFTRTLRHVYSLATACGFRSVPSFMKSTEDISWVAAMNYHPQPWHGPITLFRATEQPDPRLPQDLGWTPLAKGGVEVFELPGDHDLVFVEPNIQVLAEQLRARLQLSDAAEARLHDASCVTK
jgi:thioesterase domain-containing protein